MQIISGYENMNIESIHLFLNTEAYWSKGISLSTVDKACKHSFCIGVFINEKQIAFSRIVTDFSTFAYLCDVYVLSEYRNQGVSK
jgi:hypothetical protein